MSHCRTVTVEVDVDVDLSEFELDDLVEELESRGRLAIPHVDKDDLDALFYALKFGLTERALEIARRIAQDSTGMIL